jgi:hypothetical protein
MRAEPPGIKTETLGDNLKETIQTTPALSTECWGGRLNLRLFKFQAGTDNVISNKLDKSVTASH